MARRNTDQDTFELLCSIDEGYIPSEEEARQLTNLKGLSLRPTSITALSESISQLTNLQWLDLGHTSFTALPESIGQLANLKELFLNNTSITALPESIGQLANLEGLYLNNTSITALPESIGQLANLEELYLNNTSITALPESIGQLANLRVLDIDNTSITALPKSIGQLTNLKRLDLTRTRITALPESVGQLVNLERLAFSDTPITALPESIGQLANLEGLYLGRTRITALPESIGQLTKLEKLHIGRTQITVLPESIGQLTGLKELSLYKTRISSLPDSVRNLEGLETLDLSETEIVALPEWIGELPALTHLDLESLALHALPKSLAMRGLPFVDIENWNYGKTGVNLHCVTLVEQDVTVFLEHPELIPTLYREDEEKIILRECRVIFLGDGASGKSYTIKRIRNEGRKETKITRYRTSETPGVEILDYRIDRGEESFDVHFWDFGGQQLLHSMHRCFLSEETCYVVTVKTRETKADERARYWLRNVTAFAPRAPILLFVNCWGDDDGRRSIDEPGICQEFPKIRKVVYCSAKRAEDAEFREELMEPIFCMAEGSEGVSKKVPAKWDRVRRAIEAESK